MLSQLRTYGLLIAAFAMPLAAQPHRVVRGTVSPQARPRFDRGRVAPDTPMQEMSVVLRRSPEQQAALEQLLADQQNPASPRYHQWLSPEAFAARFGAAQQDAEKVAAWLESNGFRVEGVARGGDYILFSGTAGQVERAMRTEMHSYQVRGETHYANATEVSLPESIAPVVATVRGLHDFRPQSPQRRVTAMGSAPVSGAPLGPDFFSRRFPGVNALAPDDLATIYNINALYRAGIDGSGQKIAVIGQSDINLDDIRTFRSSFGLPDNDPVKILVPGSRNPGHTDSEGEADLDLEWSGAIARKATLLYVFSGSAFNSAFHAIDQVLAPVITFSFGVCEREVSSSDIALLASQSQKAAALGITWVASSGDAGAAGCENQNGAASAATTGLSVNLPASLPEVTGVGGTEFNEGGGNFFSSTLGDHLGTALSYVPETSWSDEALIATKKLGGFASSGGGASIAFSKPSWQKGLGVPADGARDVPDVALTASFFHDPYVMIADGGQPELNGGTSASAPVFAGIITLINQRLVSTGALAQPGLGNLNPMLYSLARAGSTGFHDITDGSNVVPCVKGSSDDCTSNSMGFQAGTGYDLVTGLGSVDAFNLALDVDALLAPAPRLAVTRFVASTTARVGGSFSLSFTVANQGNADAAAFQARALFTTDGTIDTTVASVTCSFKGLAAGASADCSGTVSLGTVVPAGTYQMLAVAGDSSTGLLASTGPLTVTK